MIEVDTCLLLERLSFPINSIKVIHSDFTYKIKKILNVGINEGNTQSYIADAIEWNSHCIIWTHVIVYKIQSRRSPLIKKIFFRLKICKTTYDYLLRWTY